MKNILCLTVCALSLLAFASAAQSGVAQATGSFQFDLAGAAGTVNFDSHIYADGTVDGQMSFTATVDTGDPGTGDTVPLTIALTALFDCVVVNGNRAAMGGVITAADAPGYVGQHTILTVADNEEGNTQPTDGFNWGVYEPKPNLVSLTGKDYDFCPAYIPPTREELGCKPHGPCNFPAPPACLDDPGPTLTWIATDAECPSCDPGVPAGLSTTQIVVSCESFPLAAYPLNQLSQGSGNIQVHVGN